MVSFTDENETEPFKGSDSVANWSVDREFGHLGWQLCLGNKGLNHGRARFQGFRAETVNVKLDRGSDVGERGVVGVTFANNDTLQTKRICDVAVGVLLDNYLQLFGDRLPHSH